MSPSSGIQETITREALTTSRENCANDPVATKDWAENSALPSPQACANSAPAFPIRDLSRLITADELYGRFATGKTFANTYGALDPAKKENARSPIKKSGR